MGLNSHVNKILGDLIHKINQKWLKDVKSYEVHEEKSSSQNQNDEKA